MLILLRSDFEEVFGQATKKKLTHFIKLSLLSDFQISDEERQVQTTGICRNAMEQAILLLYSSRLAQR
jgi:hypothetical protein